MSLKDDLPTLEKGSPDLGGQLRALREVMVKLIDIVEAHPEAFATADTPTEDKPTDGAEAPAEAPETAEAPAAAKPASKTATRSAAK